MSVVPIRGADLDAAEVAWFAPLCSDDYRHLGVPDGSLRSSWENTSRIVRRADELGFRNILCPSSYQVGQDTMTFAAAVAPLTERINLLAAIRCGELQHRAYCRRRHDPTAKARCPQPRYLLQPTRLLDD